MSVALRGSPRGSLGTLRRTASLEFFLDMDKECAVEEVELDTPPPRPSGRCWPRRNSGSAER